MIPGERSPLTLLPGVSRAGELEPPVPASKRAGLTAILGSLGRTLVAYSGGVDSAVLLVEAHRVLGAGACGVIADSPSLPRAELRSALALAEAAGIGVRVARTRELERASYRANGTDRCYHCKAELFGTLEEMARAEGFSAIAYGAVTDDLGDVRPGMAAARERGIRAPLLEAGFSKLETRALALRLGLRVWDKPQAACLASRLPHGTEVTADRLALVENAEAWLMVEFGLRVLRVRLDAGAARIEVSPADVPRLSGAEAKPRIELKMKELGFRHAIIDPRGYRRADPMPVPAQEAN